MFVLDRERQKEKKRRTIAFVLSIFIPGLGQLVRRRIGAALFFLISFAFLIWLINELWQINFGIFGTFTGLFILYLINTVDAYKGPSSSSAPCEKRCPAGINIPHYIALVREGRFSDALISIMDRMPLPAACGRICHHPCEVLCALRKKQSAVAIECLKRASSDFGETETREKRGAQKTKTVGIVGAGPAGLSAGYFLARRGYPVTVYEREQEPGGLLLWGIPAFRLPREILKKDILSLQQFGIDIRCGVRIGKDMEFEELRQAHDALLIAVGTPKSRALDVPGVEKDGVAYALEILSAVRHGDKPHLEGPVAVIGGGNTAFDAARTAIRTGAEKVTIYYRRNEQEMPGNKEELAMAQREGVAIEYHAAPIRFTGDERLSGIEFVRTELKPIAGKSRSEVIPLIGTNFTIVCGNALIATGQEPDFTFLSDEVRKRIANQECIRVHPTTMATAIPGIFAAGDITGGRMKTVVDAVEMGRKAAQGIDWYLRGAGAWQRMVERLTAFDYPLPHTARRSPSIKDYRHEQKLLDEKRAKKTFDEVELGLSEEQAKKEASRCLQCNRLF